MGLEIAVIARGVADGRDDSTVSCSEEGSCWSGLWGADAHLIGCCGGGGLEVGDGGLRGPVAGGDGCEDGDALDLGPGYDDLFDEDVVAEAEGVRIQVEVAGEDGEVAGAIVGPGDVGVAGGGHTVLSIALVIVGWRCVDITAAVCRLWRFTDVSWRTTPEGIRSGGLRCDWCCG